VVPVRRIALAIILRVDLIEDLPGHVIMQGE
jgi:hypothetical protein